MSNRTKELAKFFAGVAAMETVAHWLLGFSGVLPLTFFGITVTGSLNVIAMVFWPIATWLLIYWAWLKDAWAGRGSAGGGR